MDQIPTRQVICCLVPHPARICIFAGTPIQVWWEFFEFFANF